MRNSVTTVALAASAIVTALFGCSGSDEGSSARVSFVTKYAPIEFYFPAGWYVNPEDNPYDLQCFSQSDEMNAGVFAFKKLDIAADATPVDIFWEQVNDLKSKRRNVEQLEAIQKHEKGDKTVTSITYIGDKDSSRYCYRFSLIEFRNDDSRFAVVIQVARPGEWKKNQSILEEITQSARSMAESE